jgi:glycolate oxidase iron-sulfur subunit
MKDYGRLLDTDDARAFSARVRDFSEWLADRPPVRQRVTDTTVVVQDPCHLRHVQHAEAAVRTVLAPGHRLVELDDGGLCCGAGGAYSVTEPGLSAQVRDRKVETIRTAAGDGPFVVASANPGCAMHMAAAGLTVRHPAELIAEAME